MPFKLLLIILSLLSFSCTKSEKLNDEELQYLKLTVSLSKIRATAADSLSLSKSLDSAYRVYHLTEEAYKDQTINLAETPERANIIFRAVNDTLSKIK